VRAEDHELFVRTCLTTSFARLPDPLLFYREGRVDVANYVRSSRTDRRIYRRYGPGLVGRRATVGLLAGSLAREATYRAAGIAGRQDLLTRRRSEPLPADDASAARAVIDTILATPVPGWD
jgi:hypothetical protein